MARKQSKTGGSDPKPEPVDKRQLILDCAEALWANDSYEAVTIRQIMARARLPFSLVTYYFGTKEALFAAVIHRRVDEHSAQIHHAFDAAIARAGDRPPAADEWIDALVQPVYSHLIAPDEGWRNYMRLVSRSAAVSQAQGHLSPLHASYGTAIQRFTDGIKRIAPQADDATATWAFYFIHSSALATYLDIGTLDILTGGRLSTGDFPEISRRFARFFAPTLIHLQPA